MRRRLIAIAGTLTLTAATLGPAAVADGPDGPSDGSDLTGSGSITPGMQAADGIVTSFVAFDADAAVDRDGTYTLQSAQSAEDEVTAIADRILPEQQAQTLSSQSSQPTRIEVTSNLVAGMLVAGEAEQIRELEEEDEVETVYLVTPKEPSNKGTDFFTGAAEAWENYGATGEDVKIGVIDTGLDYTHATFNGSGNYEEAYGDNGTEKIPEDALDEDKVVGGEDFAGYSYDASSEEPGDLEPEPDENYIDSRYDGPASGHGSHVAATAAGYGVDADGDSYTEGDYGSLEADEVADWEVGPGSAPEAQLYGYKVFGDQGGSTALTMLALEQAEEDDVDVINLSLGSTYGPADDPENLFIDQLSEQGTVVVAAAGNDGDITDIGGSPGNAASAISVANSIGDTMTFDALKVLEANNEDLEGERFAMQNSVEYTGDDVEGDVVYLGDDVTGCEEIDDEEADGNIVWLQWDDDDLACPSGERWDNAAEAGATGVLIGTEKSVFEAGIAGNDEIPGGQLTKQSTDELLEDIEAGDLKVQMGPSYSGDVLAGDEDVADLLNPSSSRGNHGSLGVVNPDVAAPGTNISSAASGTGHEAHTLTGTSMATPHAAGIAALLRDENDGWTPQQVKSAMMNTASHPLFSEPSQEGNTYGPERIGSGRIDAAAATGAEIFAYASDAPEQVSLSFGVLDVTEEGLEVSQDITIDNSGEAAQQLEASYEPRTTMEGGSITVDPATVEVPAGGEATVTVTLEADAETLTREIDPTQNVASSLGVPREYVAAISGELVLTGESGEEEGAYHVPVHAAPRPVSDLEATNAPFAPGEDSAGLEVNGRQVTEGGWQSRVAAMELVATSPALDETPEDASPSTIASGDIRYVGVTSTAPEVQDDEEAGPGHLGVGLAMDGEWTTLGATMNVVIDIYPDGGGDPKLQTVVQKFPEEDVTVAATFDDNDEQLALEPVNLMWGDDDTEVFDNSVLVAPIPLDVIENTVGEEVGEEEVSIEVRTSSPYAEDPGVVDSIEEPISYDPFEPEYWVTGGESGTFFRDTDEDLTLHRATEDVVPAAAQDDGVDQLLLLHSANDSPESRPQVIDAEELAEPQETQTTLEVDGEPVAGETATLTATVEPDQARGTVTFYDGQEEIGSAEVANGEAALDLELAEGSYALTADFVPDNEEAWLPSTSNEVTLDVGSPEEPTGEPTEEPTGEPSSPAPSPSEPGGGLPGTGAPLTALVVLAAVLLGGGGFILLRRRANLG